jgi:hypothetical protein
VFRVLSSEFGEIVVSYLLMDSVSELLTSNFEL